VKFESEDFPYCSTALDPCLLSLVPADALNEQQKRFRCPEKAPPAWTWRGL